MADSQNSSSTQTGATEIIDSKADNIVDQSDDVVGVSTICKALPTCGDMPISESDSSDIQQTNVTTSQKNPDKPSEFSHDKNEIDFTPSSITSLEGSCVDTQGSSGLIEPGNIVFDEANVNDDVEGLAFLDEDALITNVDNQFNRIDEVEEENDDQNECIDPSNIVAAETDASFSATGLPSLPISRANNRLRPAHEQRKSLNIILEEDSSGAGLTQRHSSKINASSDGTYMTLKEQSSLLSKESTFGTRLPPLTPGQAHIGRIPTAGKVDVVTSKTDRRERDRTQSQQSTKSRVPPSFQRVATFTNLSRSRVTPRDGPSRYYEEPRRIRKLVSWSEAANARPPLQIDLDGPGPCDYSPRSKPLHETNSPSWSFGQKCTPEKEGGARTSWTKSWFQSPHLWSQKLDFRRDKIWPTPNQYTKGDTVGVRHTALHTAPSYSLGARNHEPVKKKEDAVVDNEIASCEYFPDSADGTVFPRAASFSHGRRRGGTILWASAELTPGPGSYEILSPNIAVPAFTIRGFRRDKSHQLGPFATL